MESKVPHTSLVGSNFHLMVLSVSTPPTTPKGPSSLEEAPK